MIQDKNRLTFKELNPTFLYGGKRCINNFNLHNHDYIEMVLVLSGNCRYMVEDTLCTLTEGDILVLNPSVRHRPVRNEGEEDTGILFFMGFTDVQVQGFQKNCIPLLQGGYAIHMTGDPWQKIVRICSYMEAEKSVDKQGRYFMLKAYLMQILILLIREQSEPLSNTDGRPFESINKKYVVEQIMEYFEDHYSEKVSLDRIAENMYLSTYYISKIFKSETGEAPIRHLINIRLEKAKEILLSVPDLSIQEVAASVGYEDAYHFSKLYKKHFGISPSQTRKSEEV